MTTFAEAARDRFRYDDRGAADSVRQEMASAIAAINAAWTTWVPTLVGATSTLGEARYKQIGKTVHFEVYFTITSAVSATLTISLPVTARPVTFAPVVGSARAWDAGTGSTTGIALLGTTTTMLFISTPGAAFWSNNTPHTWANTDVLQCSGTYEAA